MVGHGKHLQDPRWSDTTLNEVEGEQRSAFRLQKRVISMTLEPRSQVFWICGLRKVLVHLDKYLLCTCNQIEYWISQSIRWGIDFTKHGVIRFQQLPPFPSHVSSLGELVGISTVNCYVRLSMLLFILPPRFRDRAFQYGTVLLNEFFPKPRLIGFVWRWNYENFPIWKTVALLWCVEKKKTERLHCI